MTRKNTLERLAEARPPALDLGAERSDARQARDLDAAFRQLPRREPPRQTVLGRRRGPVIALAGTALAAVAAVVTAVALPGGSQQGPAAGPSVPQVSASTARPAGDVRRAQHGGRTTRWAKPSGCSPSAPD
jgi:hypothetical protein